MATAHGGISHGPSDGTFSTSFDSAWLSLVCGHCGTSVPAAVIAHDGPNPSTLGGEVWFRCSNCRHASVVSDGRQYPAVAFGDDISGVPADTYDAYMEARRCTSVNSWSGCEMICRKILMHVAVDKGAKTGDNFAAYVSYLEKNGFVTPPMKPWVDIIRKRGNSAVHELPATTKKQAEGIVLLTQHLLRNVYEMEHLAQQFAPPPAP
ncbi:DUF4145 domain-containing protein [Jatrophihabitans fulvus]